MCHNHSHATVFYYGEITEWTGRLIVHAVTQPFTLESLNGEKYQVPAGTIFMMPCLAPGDSPQSLLHQMAEQFGFTPELVAGTPLPTGTAPSKSKKR